MYMCSVSVVPVYLPVLCCSALSVNIFHVQNVHLSRNCSVFWNTLCYVYCIFSTSLYRNVTFCVDFHSNSMIMYHSYKLMLCMHVLSVILQIVLTFGYTFVHFRFSAFALHKTSAVTFLPRSQSGNVSNPSNIVMPSMDTS